MCGGREGRREEIIKGEREDGKTKKKEVHPGTVSVGNGITSHTKLSEKASRKEIHLA